MKKKSLFLIALAVVLLSGGLFYNIAYANPIISTTIQITNQQHFAARTAVLSGNVSGLRARILNTSTSVGSVRAERIGTNLQGNVTSATVHLQLGHWAEGTHQIRVQGADFWNRETVTSQMRSR